MRRADPARRVRVCVEGMARHCRGCWWQLVSRIRPIYRVLETLHQLPPCPLLACTLPGWVARAASVQDGVHARAGPRGTIERNERPVGFRFASAGCFGSGPVANACTLAGREPGYALRHAPGCSLDTSLPHAFRCVSGVGFLSKCTPLKKREKRILAPAIVRDMSFRYSYLVSSFL